MKSSIIYLGFIIALLATSCSNNPQQQVEEKPAIKTQNPFIFVGTYTRKEGHVNGKSSGIHLLEKSSQDGTLKEISVTQGVINPSYLVISPNKKYLYAVNETGPEDGPSGTVSAFAILPGGKGLTLLNSQPSQGFAPCYLSMDNAGRYVFVANYMGKVAMIPVNADGTLGETANVLDLPGKGPHPRQEASHPHSIVLSPDNRYAFVADLGTDRIWKLKVDYNQGKLILNEAGKGLEIEPGSGPRHLVFHPNGKWAFVINELGNTLTGIAYRAETGDMIHLETVSTLPKAFSGENYTADIHISPDGKYLYGSNRGHNTIVSFSIDQKIGRLSLLEHESTRGDYPRNFMIDNQGQYLYVANQNSDNIVTFRIAEGGGLEFVREVESLTPVCLKMVDGRR